ncbi:MAG: 2-keto-4-pentenoate hydratase/2-oxohepta-3-ene-1,7-dioic acid hydratase in catechol pathway [Candidatus Azotimanducaceae bacterium]|jgi:2-keto-4-pentenoate hydratase/2-oxohepta-3-ene-1,7-dioic acid hydratase in catechol pathway
MKLLTYNSDTGLQLGALIDPSRVLNLQLASQVLDGEESPALESLLTLMQGGTGALEKAQIIIDRALSAGEEALCEPLDELKLCAPIPQPPRLRCFSVYERHMTQAIKAIVRARAGRAGLLLNKVLPLARVPKDFYQGPPYYKGNPMSVIGPNDEVPWPSFAETKLDYEIELGVFIGIGGQDIKPADAKSHIFGYTVYNDFSARDRLMKEMMGGSLGPIKGKDFEGGNAIGPWVVTKDEIANPENLAMVVRVNGKVMAETSTREMHYGIDAMIERASEAERLVPGEFIATGAAADGTGIERWQFLDPGDVVELDIEGIGTLRNKVMQLHLSGDSHG